MTPNKPLNHQIVSLTPEKDDSSKMLAMTPSRKPNKNRFLEVSYIESLRRDYDNDKEFQFELSNSPKADRFSVARDL